MTNVITKIGLAGIGPFKKQVLDIPSGVVYLYGKNMKRDAEGNGNAAGKSLLGASVSEIFYDTPIVGTRQDKNKQGQRFVEFMRGKRKIRIMSAFKGKSQKLSVMVDGKKDESGRTNKNTKELIAKYWPINEKEYRTYGHLDARKTHSLVGGSSQERKAFFTEFFGLDKLDAERKVIAGEISRLKKITAAHTELKRTFEEVKADMLSKADREAKEAQEASLKKKFLKLRAAFDEYTAIQQTLQFEEFAAEKLKAFNKLVPDLDDFESIMTSARKRLKKAEALEEQMSEWKQYQKELARYNKAIEGVDMFVPMEKLEAYSKEFRKAESLLEDEPEAPKKVSKPERPDTDKNALIGEQQRLQHQLEHAKKFKTGKCYACGQDVKAEDPEKVRARLKKVNAALESWDAYDAQLRKYTSYKEAVKDYEEEIGKFEAAKATVAKRRKAHELYEKRRNIIKPEKVEKPAEAEDVEPIRAELELLRFFDSKIPIIKALKAITPEQRKLKVDGSELTALQDKLMKVGAALSVHNAVKGRAKKMKARLDELQEQTSDREALELLYEGYSDKAVKKMVVEAINNHLMEATNAYAPIVFDDYRFEFHWGTQVQILVHRPGMATTDVRKLSGAESTLFTLVVLMALLKFVPPAKRLSMIILDEPAASFSEQTTELFHRLLPHLNKLIPTIMVITPDSRERYEGATELTVVRDRDGARVVKGHPSEL